jgi:hypothetical protein
MADEKSAPSLQIRVALAAGQMLCYGGNGRFVLAVDEIKAFAKAFSKERKLFSKAYRRKVRAASAAAAAAAVETVSKETEPECACGDKTRKDKKRSLKKSKGVEGKSKSKSREGKSKSKSREGKSKSKSKEGKSKSKAHDCKTGVGRKQKRDRTADGNMDGTGLQREAQAPGIARKKAKRKGKNRAPGGAAEIVASSVHCRKKEEKPLPPKRGAS